MVQSRRRRGAGRLYRHHGNFAVNRSRAIVDRQGRENESWEEICSMGGANGLNGANGLYGRCTSRRAGAKTNDKYNNNNPIIYISGASVRPTHLR